MSKAVTIEGSPSLFEGISARIEAFDRREWFLITAALALVVFVQFQFWKIPSITDRANWDYMAQSITRGAVPYRDVVNIKSPLSAYIGAAAILGGRLVGIRDIFAIRIGFLLLAVLTVSFTFLVARESFDSRRIGLLAALAMMSFTAFIRLSTGGVQPKTGMILFGLISLWGTLKDRPLLAGVAGMLSALCWQPGLMFVGAAGLGFSRYLTNWRDLKVVRLLIGASIPLVAIIIVMAAAGALKDLYIWTLGFNASVYAVGEMRPLRGFFERLGTILNGSYYNGHLYFYIAVVGVVAAIVREVRHARTFGRRSFLERAPRHGVVICLVVYFAFCMIDIQGGADMIPFLPLVASMAAAAIVWTIDEFGALAQATRLTARPTAVASWLFAAVCVLALIVDVVDTVAARTRVPSLKDQEAEIAELKTYLEPGDKVYVHGVTEILVLTGLPNADKHFLLDRGKDLYLDVVEPGGFDGWFQRLKAQQPKIVALGRMRTVRKKDSFVNWVESDYEKHEGKIFTYYVRKDAPGVSQPGSQDGPRKRAHDKDDTSDN